MGLRRGAAVLLAGLAVAGMTGCATVRPQSPEAVVKERAQQRWDALVRWDTKAAYEHFSPGSRAVLKYEDWVTSLRKGFWKSAQVDRVACPSADSCEAYVTIEYEFRGMRTRTPLREAWIRDGSNWWYLQK